MKLDIERNFHRLLLTSLYLYSGWHRANYVEICQSRPNKPRARHGQAIFASGSPFPPVTLAGKTRVPGQERLRDVAAAVALRVAEVAFSQGLATCSRPADLGAAIKAMMYVPDYPSLPQA